MLIEELYKYVKSSGVKQIWLAQQLGITSPTLSMALRGKRPLKHTLYFEILRLLKINEDDLRAI